MSERFWRRLLRPLRERYLARRYGTRGMPRVVNGVACRVRPECRASFPSEYESHLSAWLAPLVRPGTVGFDVGANVGTWVVQLAAWVGTSGRVVAFEPNPAAVALLRRNVSMSALDDLVRVEPSAVGRIVGAATLRATGVDGMSRLAVANPLLAGKTQAIEVPIVSIDLWCEKTGDAPDWMLIDVEGFEGDVLAGAAATIARRGPSLSIVAEFHPNAWPSIGTSAEEMRSLIAGLGLSAAPLSGQHDLFAEYGHVLLQATGHA